MRFARLRGAARSVAGFAALLVLAAAAFAVSRGGRRLRHDVENVRNLPERLLTRWVAPKGGTSAALTPLERQAVAALSRRLDAEIVWSSNRGGNHDLYVLDLRSQSLRRITTSPNVDSFPRWSPDGSRIVFHRSTRPWVSFRERGAWEVYVIGADGANERLLARNAESPRWSADGRFVVFSRDGHQIVRVGADGGAEEVIFDAERSIPGAYIDFGSLSPDGTALSFAIAGPFDGIALWDLAAARLVPVQQRGACEITWAPDGRWLAWISVGGNGGTRVMETKDGRQSVLIDLPGEYSHEYFPNVSNDGRWLVWGASAEGHEQDRADYEIFLWRIGTPPQEAVRLTYDPANDQWPDVHIRRELR